MGAGGARLASVRQLRRDRQIRSFDASLRALGVTADLAPLGADLDVLGVEVDEPWPLPVGSTVTVEPDGAEADTWAEVVEPVTAAVVASYSGGPLAGRAALTRNQVGAGPAWYLGTCSRPPGIQSLLRSAASRRCRPPRPVEIVTRAGQDARYTFVLNHASQPATIPLPVTGLDLLSGKPVGGTVTLAATDAGRRRPTDRRGRPFPGQAIPDRAAVTAAFEVGGPMRTTLPRRNSYIPGFRS